MPKINRRRAKPPFVLALDVGSSGTRARLYDVTASHLDRVRGRVKHTLNSGADGSVVCDADAILRECEQVIDQALAGDDGATESIAGVALDTFASSLVGVDGSGKAVTPVFTYADSRPAAQVDELRRTLDERAVQQRTGCRFHASYLPARFLWLAQTQPEALKSATSWMSIGEYVYQHLLGQRAVSFSTAAWTGLLNRQSLAWDEELFEHLPVTVDQMSPLHDDTETLQGPRRAYTRRWPQLAKAKWFPAVADGYASNLGSDAMDPTVYGLSLGSSGAVRALLAGPPETVPEGLWCYAVNRRQALLGGAINDAGRAVAWLRNLLKLPPDEELSAVAAAPPRADTPVVLPFLTGERSPGWAAQATASVSHLDLHTDAAAIFRGMLEGTALRLALVTDQLRDVAGEVKRVVAGGGAIEGLPAWGQMLADMLELPIVHSLEGQTTLRGTAVMALAVLAPGKRPAPGDIGEHFEPNPAHFDAYRAARDRQQRVYGALVGRG